jgi:hypothetical protein
VELKGHLSKQSQWTHDLSLIDDRLSISKSSNNPWCYYLDYPRGQVSATEAYRRDYLGLFCVKFIATESICKNVEEVK